MKRYFYIIAGTFLLATACKKDDTIAPATMTVSKLLAGDTAKTWIDFYRSGTRADSSPFTIVTPCYTDDYWVFKTNGYFEMNEGGSKCSVADPYVFTTGNWKLSADNKYIELSNIAVNPNLKPGFKLEILEITPDKLSLKIVTADMYVSTTLLEEDHVMIAK
jgi:Lipocalin-like domain